jgi:PAS domain S-box-containing protein
MSYVLTEAQSAVFDLLESSPYPSFVVDAQTFRICKASQSAVDFYQYAKKDLLHLSFLDLHTSFCQRELIGKLKTNTSFTLSLEQQKKDGSICTVELNASLLPSDLNTYYHITVIDCSKWMNQINRYQSYIEQSSEAVWRYELREPVSIYLQEDEIIEHIHRHAYLAECNNRFAEMYQFSDSTQLLSTSLEVIFDFSRPENIDYLRTFIRNNYTWIDAERKFIDAHNNTFYFSSNLIGIVEDGFLKGGWGTQRNITEKKKIELELKESEDRFRELADTAPAMIWICDENNKTTYVNRSWIEFTGLDLTNKVTEDWAAIIHPEDREQTIQACRNAAAQKEAVTVTYRLLDQQGKYKWVVDTSTPRLTEAGKFIGYIGSLIDITDQKEKEEQLRYQSTLFENVSDIVVTTDLNFVVKSWNKVAEEYYGFTRSEAAGKRIDDLLAFNYIGATQQDALQDLLTKGKWSGEVLFENQQSEKRYLWQTVAFVYDDAGEKVGVMAVG